MTCPCLRCPEFRQWCIGTINAHVSWSRESGAIEAQRLVAGRDEEQGKWEGETVRVEKQKEAK